MSSHERYERIRSSLGPDGSIAAGSGPVKVRVGGKDLTVERLGPAAPKPFAVPSTVEYMLGVKMPELVVEPEPCLKVEDLGNPWHRSDRDAASKEVPPEVAFRMGVRRCLSAGVSREKLLEIMDLETARSVMES